MGKFLFAALAVTAIAGCHVGPSASAYAAARTPYGARVTLAVRGERVDVELLAVRDSALLVLRSQEVLLVPFRAITTARFAGSNITLSDGRAPTARQAERLRLTSRYPQGVSPELERRLLAAYGQTALVVAGS